MTSSQGQERAISSAINTSEVAPNAASGLGTVEASDRATLELKGSLKSLGHEPDNAPAPSDVAVKPTENPKTEFEKQKQETQGELQDIINERQKLAETGKQLDTREGEIKIQLEMQAREGIERSKEARAAVNEISNLIPDGAPNSHRDALKKTLETLPDMMTAKDVADFTERARWDAAKASVGDKDFANMSQTEKDVVSERVKKMGENNSSNPESGHWDAAKESSGLSPDTKWENMSPVEQKLVQERFMEAKKKGDVPVPASSAAATVSEANLGDAPVVAPTVAPQIFSEPTDTSEVALNAAPDTSTNTIQIPRTEGRAPTVVGRGVSSGDARDAETQASPVDGKNDNTNIDTSLGFDRIQGKKHGYHTELDKKLSDGSTVSVYNNNGTRSINIGPNIRFADDNAYNSNINITFKRDGNINEIVDTRNWNPLTGNSRTKILEELKNIGLTLPN